MITLNELNPRLLHAQYAVRGPIVQRAQELEAQGKKIIYCNIGNPQALKQLPLSYLRQALSLLENPTLLDNASVTGSYPRDIVERVRLLLQKHPFGTGAYTQSPGIPFVRQAVADFITRRDGVKADKDHIILTDGASKGVQAVLTALLCSPHDGVMTPIPQYPLYSASLALYGGQQIGYYLDEENRWQLNEQILEASIRKALDSGIRPVAIVVINPGNPTGAVLSRDNIGMIVRFARTHKLSIIADEVYQENVYDTSVRFHSFTRVMGEMGVNDITLFTLHSVSKGFLGECGHRGGYLEMRNIPDDVLGQFIKLQSISLCANVSGQFATYFMVAPPQAGDESYATYVAERDGILSALKRKAEILGAGINDIPGMRVDIPQGSMYAFVRFELPSEKNIDVSRLSPEERELHEGRRDSAYCLALLEETGICVVPGSGFGQKAGTFHFRTTFLPPQDEIESLVLRLKTFHEKYVHVLEEA